MDTNQRKADIIKYLNSNYECGNDTDSIANTVNSYMLEQGIESSEPNIDNVINDIYFK